MPSSRKNLDLSLEKTAQSSKLPLKKKKKTSDGPRGWEKNTLLLQVVALTLVTRVKQEERGSIQKKTRRGGKGPHI